jgi:hypothetical protein
VEVATSRLFATQGLDTLKTMTGLRLKPVLAPTEAIQREMKKRLGVGADTIDTLGEEATLQVVDDENEEDTNLDNAAEDASIYSLEFRVSLDGFTAAMDTGGLDAAIRACLFVANPARVFAFTTRDEEGEP